MLKPAHLDAIRAALKFWIEEMGESTTENVLNYVDNNEEGVLSLQQFVEVKDFVDQSTIRYMKVADIDACLIDDAIAQTDTQVMPVLVPKSLA